VGARTVRIALAVLLGIGGVIALIAFFNSRDDSTFSGTKSPGQAFADQGARHLRPGASHPRYDSDPPTSGPHVARLPARDGGALSDDEILEAVELGNVVLLHSPGTSDAPLRAVARELDAGYDRDLADSGSAVLVGTRAGAGPVVAVAWRHLQRAASPSDPSIADFAEFHLGSGAGSPG
jgi:hypothetical protein